MVHTQATLEKLIDNAEKVFLENPFQSSLVLFLSAFFCSNEEEKQRMCLQDYLDGTVSASDDVFDSSSDVPRAIQDLSQEDFEEEIIRRGYKVVTKQDWEERTNSYFIHRIA